MALEQISEIQFQMLSRTYNNEKAELTTKVEVLENDTGGEQKKLLNTDRLTKVFDKYTNHQRRNSIYKLLMCTLASSVENKEKPRT